MFVAVPYKIYVWIPPELALQERIWLGGEITKVGRKAFAASLKRRLSAPRRGANSKTFTFADVLSDAENIRASSSPPTWRILIALAFLAGCLWAIAASGLFVSFTVAILVLGPISFGSAYWAFNKVDRWTDTLVDEYTRAVANGKACQQEAALIEVEATPPCDPVRAEDVVEQPKPPVSELPSEGGTTPESAIRIHAANSLEGIPKEYAVLNAMFGAPNVDWKLIERSLLDPDDGRRLEKLVISASGKRREIYFDLTECFKGNTSKEAKANLKAIIAPHDRPLTIQLPKEEFMTLQMGLLRLTEAQLNQLGLSEVERMSMLDPLLDALKPWHGKEYTSIPEHVSVTTLISVGTKIKSLLMFWEPANLLQEEELENLKAIIGGTVKAALNASRRT